MLALCMPKTLGPPNSLSAPQIFIHSFIHSFAHLTCKQVSHTYPVPENALGPGNKEN